MSNKILQAVSDRISSYRFRLFAVRNRSLNGDFIFLRWSLVLSIAIFILFSINGQSQTKKTIKKSKVQYTRRLNKEKPSVYIEFSRFGTISSKVAGDTRKIVWLKLYNNLNTDIFFCRYDFTENRDEVIGLHYEIEPPPRNLAGFSEEAQESIKIPRGYPIFDFCDFLKIKGGKSIEFPIPQDHFIKNTRIKISFLYVWENLENPMVYFDPLHFIYFYSRDLPNEK